ncbi:DUF11 domain-containing protein [Conexibacter woesei]|uniref:DUF11 domain-containing protein n=1 Tax=Conexibacter woesei TaxID=191495 RepID=UPI00041A34F3|nr:DUF11 domain-containing protein [Conexibacter woesei]
MLTGLLAALLAGPAIAVAAAPRAVLNGSFEEGYAVAPNRFAYLEAANDPDPQPSEHRLADWSTTSPPAGPADAPAETWGTGYDGVEAPAGGQFVEVNVDVPARMFQTVCLTTGDRIGWSFAHRNRRDDDDLHLGVYRAGSLVPSYTDPSVEVQRLADVTSTTDVWTRHSGPGTFTGATGLYELGAEGQLVDPDHPGAGNLLDDVDVELAPLAEIESGTPGALDPARRPWPLRIALSGRLRAAGTLTVALSGAGLDPDAVTVGAPSGVPGAHAAIAGGDITVAVPPGVYGSPGEPDVVSVPVDLAAAARDGAAHVRAQLTAAAPARVGPAEDCGGTGTSERTVTLAGVVTDLQVTAVAEAVRGGQYVAEIRVRNVGSARANGVVGQLTLPADLDLQVTAATAGTCGRDGARVRCGLGSIAPGATELYAVAGRVPAGADMLTARAVTADVTPADAEPDNNHLTLVTPVQDPPPVPSPAPMPTPTPAPPGAAPVLPAPAPAFAAPAPAPAFAAPIDLGVTVRAPRRTVYQGDDLAFHVRVTNRGTRRVSGARVRLAAVPQGRIAAPPGTTCSGGRPRVCTLPPLAAGGSATLVVHADARSARRYAVLAAALAPSADTHPRDNLAAAVKRVTATPAGSCAAAGTAAASRHGPVAHAAC